MTDETAVKSAFRAAINIWHSYVDSEIAAHQGFCTHPECDDEECSRPDSAVEYFTDSRGWDRGTIERWKLGYAPPDLDVAEILMDSENGFSEETVRATGLFTQSEYDDYDLKPLFSGRYIFPYFDADGQAVYAIARTTGSKGGGAAGYDGHREDFLAGKYAKVAHQQDYCPIDEPFFGLNTLDDSDTVVIAEGIADAITAAEAGHAVLSPVTTEFKRKHFDPLCDTLEEHDVGEVVVLPDSEEASFARIDSDDVPNEPQQFFEAINIPSTAPGLGGALRTANYLCENGIDAFVSQLPRAGLRKVDLDDYLHGWHDDLDAVLRSARKPQTYPEFETATASQDTTTPPADGGTDTHPEDPDADPHGGRDSPLTRDSGRSALWELDVGDVNDDLTAGYRGKNPLGHTGDSETYFVVYEKPLDDGDTALIGKDYKRGENPRFTGCTYLLVEQGERSVSDPEGELSPKETWVAWKTARKRELIDESDVIPSAALEYIAKEAVHYPVDKVPDDEPLPATAHNQALKWLEYTWRPDALNIDLDDDDAESATARTYKNVTADAPVYCWQDVRDRYEGQNADKQLARHRAVKLLRQKYDFITTSGDKTLFVYDETTGTYTTELAGLGVHSEIERGLSQHWSTHELNEIMSRLEQRSIIERRQFNGRQQFEDPHVCVRNGVLNLFTGELKPHSPEHYFIERVPVPYDEDADTSVYEQYFNDWTQREADKQTLIEMVGHTLVPDANERYKKFLILTGDADNGKSVFFRCIRTLLNGPDATEQNVSNVKLSKMATQRFSNDSVYGNMANVAGEIDGKKIRNTASLKDITGGDAVEIEPKGKESFFDTINSTMMFAANDPPILGERDKKAIASRIVPVNLPYSFVNNPSENDPFEKQRRPESELEDELFTDEALSGLLRLAVDGVQRLEDNSGDVSLPESPMQRLRRYERTADPMRQFGHKCLTNQDGDYVVKADVTTIYKEWATSQGHELGSNINRTLHKALQGMRDLNYTTSRPEPADYAGVDLPLRPWNERKRVVSRVTLTDEGLEYAESAGIVERDDGDDEDGADADTEPPEHLSAGDLEASAAVSDREKVPPVRGTIMAMWENRYGKPVTELHDDDGSIDIQIMGFDSPELTPLSEGGTYELDGLRYRDPGDERPYYELRPTTGIERLDDTDADSDTDDDADGDSDETDTETPETTESPDSPETPQSSSDDTDTGEATADGGEIEAGDDADDGDSDTTETDASPSLSPEPDSIKNPDENAPESQDDRLQMFKDTLDEFTKNGEFVTADDLEAELGWDRSIIDGYLEKLRRESTLIGDGDLGWKYYK